MLPTDRELSALEELPPSPASGRRRRALSGCFSFLATLAALAAPAAATPALTVDAATGDVLYQRDATQRWFPASTTKLMTVYVALSAVRGGRIAMATPLVVSARARKMPRSKMGFPAGTQVTLDNALKMLMVRSANDIAIAVAEGVSGSVEAFAADMNAAAARLGMRDSHFVNPNGLPAPEHYTSARDMALLARTLYAQFPDQARLFDIGQLSFGRQIMRNHNTLLARYPGMDGMKTGYLCAAGWNLVASANRDGRRLVAVVFGGPTQELRDELVVTLLDRGFAGVDKPGPALAALPSDAVAPPDMREQVCGAHGTLAGDFAAEITRLDEALPAAATAARAPAATTSPATPANAPTSPAAAARIAALPLPAFIPMPIHAGADPGYQGVVAQARAPHAPLGSRTRPVPATAYAKLKAVSDEADGVLPSALVAKPKAIAARRKKPAKPRAAGATKPAEAPEREKADVDH